ncbi:transposase [Gloeomargarita lithophora Alchichica-D10]|uniref:Transposase n=1 Tax=Gloeomargarita lithophora Alchichica-D10 TaxID=1188229 RepID=A0A1J0A918_9CYAN|nr:transposase [Gloeomargarita lithophora Alchichica-D10]
MICYASWLTISLTICRILHWLKTKDYWNLDELVTHLDLNYNVIYKSKKSYYSLFSEAGITWKRSQKTNPKSEPELVKKKKKFRNIFASIEPRLSLDS